VWQDVSNRKFFFNELAQEKGFDPSDSRHWYNISRRCVFRKRGGKAVLSYHNDSFSKALRDLYPELDLREEHFDTIRSIMNKVIPT